MDLKRSPPFHQTIQEWIKVIELHCRAHKYVEDKKATWCYLIIGPEAGAFLVDLPDGISWNCLQRELNGKFGTTQPHNNALSQLLNLTWDQETVPAFIV